MGAFRACTHFEADPLLSNRMTTSSVCVWRLKEFPDRPTLEASLFNGLSAPARARVPRDRKPRLNRVSLKPIVPFVCGRGVRPLLDAFGPRYKLRFLNWTGFSVRIRLLLLNRSLQE